MTCRVLIDGVPALEVRLVLLRSDQGEPKPVLRGHRGFRRNDRDEVGRRGRVAKRCGIELTALIESVGSGDWQLNAPWSDPKTNAAESEVASWPRTFGYSASQESHSFYLTLSAQHERRSTEFRRLADSEKALPDKHEHELNLYNSLNL